MADEELAKVRMWAFDRVAPDCGDREALFEAAERLTRWVVDGERPMAWFDKAWPLTKAAA